MKTYSRVYFSLCLFLAILRRSRTQRKLNPREKFPMYGILCFSLRAKRAPSLNNSIDGIFKLMLLYYEECGIFKGFGCPTYEEEYDRCTNFQFPRQSAKLSNVSNKKNVLVLAAVFHSVAMEYLIVYPV